MLKPAGVGGARRAVIVGTVASAACALPLFVTVALSVQLADDLGFDSVRIGSLVAIFFGSLTVTSVHMGRLADRLGASRSLRIATAAAAVSALGIATVGRWASLVAWFLVAGVAASLAQPAANRLLVIRIPPRQLGTAFGFKQSAPAVASMLAGVSVPAIALTFGWRWTYLVVALVAVAATLGVGPAPTRTPTSAPPRQAGKPSPLAGRSALIVLMGGFGAALASSSAVLAFYVDAAVESGASHGVAGVLFAAASAAAIVTRLASGIACDRWSLSPLRLSAVLVTVGASGIACLATGRPVVMALGVVLALAGTWGFPGVFWLALLRAYRAAPGQVSGAMAPAAIGGIVGPLGFGLVVANVNYATAWALASGLALTGAFLMKMGERRLAATGLATG